MDFKEILERWEQSPEGRKAAESSRFSTSRRDRDSLPVTRGYTTGKASMGHLKKKPDDDTLDLHGCTREESRVRVRVFLRECIDAGMKKVSIIHGRGLHSEGGQGKLKQVVRSELKASKHVLWYGNAPPDQGGSGSTVVILQRVQDASVLGK